MNNVSEDRDAVSINGIKTTGLFCEITHVARVMLPKDYRDYKQNLGKPNKTLQKQETNDTDRF